MNVEDAATYRSVEVQLSNNTPSTLIVRSAGTAGVGATWVNGEQPSGSLPPFASVVWGVTTQDPSTDAAATVVLASAVSDVTLVLRCPGSAPAQASVADHPSIVATIQQVDTEEPGHASFHVGLAARAPAPDAPDAAPPTPAEAVDSANAAESDPLAAPEPTEPGA